MAKNQKIGNKKPFYKKWWFIILLIIIVVAFIGSLGKNKNDGEKFDWSYLEMGKYIPAPKSDIGEIITNTDESLSIYIHKTSKDDYREYVKTCEENGYVIERDKSETHYDAYNQDGYKLSLYYTESNEEFHISLDAPEIMGEFAWSENGVGSLVPIPKSNIGKVTKDSSEVYIVRVGNTTMDDYKEYIGLCEDAGFVIDYSKYDESYSAKNSEGYELDVRYEGFNTIMISIKAPQEGLVEEEVQDVNASTSEELQENDEVEVRVDEYNENNLIDGMRPEFKEAMDSYEAFYKKYCDVLKKYSKNPADLTILSEYTKLLNQTAEMSEKFEEWDEDEMNDAELKYYLEVSGRVSQMMLEAGGF